MKKDYDLITHMKLQKNRLILFGRLFIQTLCHEDFAYLIGIPITLKLALDCPSH